MGLRILRGFQNEFLTDPYRLVEITHTDIVIHVVPIWFLPRKNGFNVCLQSLFQQDAKNDHRRNEDGEENE